MLSSFVLLYCVDSSLPVWIMAYQFYSPFEPINFLTVSIGRALCCRDCQQKLTMIGLMLYKGKDLRTADSFCDCVIFGILGTLQKVYKH